MPDRKADQSRERDQHEADLAKFGLARDVEHAASEPKAEPVNRRVDGCQDDHRPIEESSGQVSGHAIDTADREKQHEICPCPCAGIAPPSQRSALRHAAWTNAQVVRLSTSISTGAATCGPTVALASGTKIRAPPNPENPRAVPASAATATVIRMAVKDGRSAVATTAQLSMPPNWRAPAPVWPELTLPASGAAARRDPAGCGALGHRIRRRP